MQFLTGEVRDMYIINNKSNFYISNLQTCPSLTAIPTTPNPRCASQTQHHSFAFTLNLNSIQTLAFKLDIRESTVKVPGKNRVSKGEDTKVSLPELGVSLEGVEHSE